MKQYPKVFFLLVISLFLAISCVDKTLDHLAKSPSQSTLVICNDKGVVVASYTGDLFSGHGSVKPEPSVLHRG